MNFFFIFKKEFKLYFSSWIAYILSSVFLIMSGYFFYTDLNFFILWGGQDLSLGMWQYFFNDVRFIMLLMIPLLTMRLFAEEKKTGTMEALLTFPLKDGEILLGKFGACLAIFVIMLALTLLCPALLYFMHNIELTPVAAGYLGLLLIGSSFISLGTFISSLTEKEIVSAFVTFISLLLFWFIAWNEAAVNELLIKILLRISLFDHFSSFANGAIESKDIIFNLSFTLFFLFLTLKSLEARKWRGFK